MTELILTELTIASTEMIVEFRNKLLNLLLELNFPDMKSISIVTKLSDLTHQIYLKEKSFKIIIGFNKATSYRLSIEFLFKFTNVEEFKNSCLFKTAEFYSSENNPGGKILLQFNILNPNFNLEKNYIQQLKEKVVVRSKAELMSEIRHKNEELNKLLEDLKKSATLIQSEKMRALGVLTAGVAHELNNPMMGILNFVQYSLKKTDKNDKRYEALQDAERETKRCMEIVTNLLTFSHLEKEDDTEFKPVDLSVLARRIIKILAYRIRNESVNVQEVIPNQVPLILGHENRLQQSILNLISNALDAMKSVKNKILSMDISSDNKNLILTISDTGEGMDEATKQKILEPFFTTKPTGSGTGLGLSVCESIIKEHQGRLVCQSEKNVGTQFSIFLPLIKKE